MKKETIGTLLQMLDAMGFVRLHGSSFSRAEIRFHEAPEAQAAKVSFRWPVRRILIGRHIGDQH